MRRLFLSKSHDDDADNASQSLADSKATQSPSLWLAIYDPQLDLTDALKMGYTRMILIAANGDNAINLGLRYRQAPNQPPAYDYGLSSVPLLHSCLPLPSPCPIPLVIAHLFSAMTMTLIF